MRAPLGSRIGRPWPTVHRGEQLQLAAQLVVIALAGFLQRRHMRGELVLGGKRRAVDAGEHLVVLVVLPVRAGELGELEGLERLGVAQVRADAHVDIVALLVEADDRVLRQVADVLDLVDFAALLHERDGFLARQGERLDRQVLLDDLVHLRLDLGEVALIELHIAQVHVVVEAVLGRRAVGKVRLRVQLLNRLREDMRRRMAQNVQFFLLRALSDNAIFVDDLHTNTSLPNHTWG